MGPNLLCFLLILEFTLSSIANAFSSPPTFAVAKEDKRTFSTNIPFLSSPIKPRDSIARFTIVKPLQSSLNSIIDLKSDTGCKKDVSSTKIEWENACSDFVKLCSAQQISKYMKSPPSSDWMANAGAPVSNPNRAIEWAEHFTSVDKLRAALGTNRNRFLGDFSPQTTRRLYHLILNEVVCEIRDIGLMQPQEFAPIAYRARQAAKQYCRERSFIPARILVMIYEGFRGWVNNSKVNVSGMTWEQIWEKYERQINLSNSTTEAQKEEIERQVSLKILERSCATNQMVDTMFLKKVYRRNKMIEAIASKLVEYAENIKLVHTMERPIQG